MQKTVSIIVPTKNRCSALKDMILSLAVQSVLPDELLICDQSDSRDSEEMTREVMAQNPEFKATKLVYIYDPTVKGTAQARNVLIKESKGDIIFLLDDDVVLENNYIEKILEVYEANPDVAGVGGVVTNVNWLKFNKIALFDNIFVKGVFKDVRRNMYLNYKDYNNCVESNKLSGCCSSYRRDILGEDPFDEVLDNILDGYAFGEDVELSMRLSNRNKLIITPLARLEHYSQSINTHRGSKERVFYLQVLSNTYIFLKLYRCDFYNNLCYLWLHVGWFIRVFMGLLRLDSARLEAYIGAKKRAKAFYKIGKY